MSVAAESGLDHTLFLTTQPGWAFASLAEIRARGIREYAGLYHRDSSLVVSVRPALLADVLDDPLVTPADVFGCLAMAEGRRERDATAALARQLQPKLLRDQVHGWLERLRRPGQPSPTRLHHFSVGSEVWGDTSVHRKTLAETAAAAFRQALPNWSQRTSGGVRLLCKADRQVAILGVQLYSNLSRRDDGRPGALREHLACGLLTVARVRPQDAVFDPFMGTGTILAAAQRHFGVQVCIGAEIDSAAYRTAHQRIEAPGTRLYRESFDAIDLDRLPGRLTLVSNLPFGVHYAQIPPQRLVGFVRRLHDRLGGVALLTPREQAGDLARAFQVRAKNVLVLGQPAAIVYAAGVPGSAKKQR
ncbi:MAG: hypothetical protein HY332_09580 [Chloroflexi bacterium]|nr:hypothetical protein [Chloroflexota bacterium]